jgi:hypothetical protein
MTLRTKMKTLALDSSKAAILNNPGMQFIYINPDIDGTCQG